MERVMFEGAGGEMHPEARQVQSESSLSGPAAAGNEKPGEVQGGRDRANRRPLTWVATSGLRTECLFHDASAS